MLIETFLSILVIWSTVTADIPYDAFETICVPNRACYYVSKFKTSWETAQHMCLEKNQQFSAKFNETDKMILNPLITNIPTKRYWVIEPEKSENKDTSHKITIVLNRKRRSFTIEYPETETVVTTAEQVKNWNLESLLENSKDRDTIKNNIKQIFHEIKAKGGNQIDVNLLNKWKKTFSFLSKARIHQKFQRTFDKWTELTDEFGKDKLATLAENLDPKSKNEFISIRTFIKNKEFDRLDLKSLTKWKRLLYKLKLKIHGEHNYKKHLLIKWKNNVRWLVKWNWMDLLKFVSIKYKDRVKIAINEMMTIVEKQEFDKISLKLIENVNFSMRLLRRLWRIHIKYGGREKEHLLRKLNFLFTINWLKTLNELEGIDKVKWTERFNKLINLIKLKKFKEIDFKWLEEFRPIIKQIKNKITIVPNINRKYIIRIKKYLKLLKRWNWKKLMVNLSEKERENIETEMQLLINILKEKRFKEIDLKFFQRFQLIFKAFRRLKQNKLPKVDMKVKKEKLINRLKLIIDSNWLKIINESKGIDKVKWTNRFNKLINFIKNNEVDKIDINWLQKFKKIIKIIKTKKEPKPITIKVITEKVKKYVNRLINWNWKELIKNVNEKDRENIKNQIELILKLVKENKFNEIDENVFKRFRVIFKTIKKINKDKLPKIDIKLEKEKIIEKLKPFIKENWVKIIDQTVDIDKEKWKNRIKTIIELINNNEIDKIDFVWLKKLKKILKIKTKPDNEKVTIDLNKITDTSNRLITNLNELKWEELIKFVDEKDQPEVNNKIKTFIQLVNNKQIEKIDNELINWIINIIPKLKKIQEIHVTNEKTKHTNLKTITEASNKYIIILNELNWEELIKYIDETNKQEVVTKIKTFIQLVNNKQYDKIDFDLINWITQIITTLKKVHEIHVTNEKTKHTNLKTITETSIKYVEFLNELKWEELIKYIDKNNKEEIVIKIKKFISFVQNKQFENIDVELINWITEIINTFKKIAVEHSKTKISEKILITKKLQITLPSNWMELIKRIDGIDQQLWISRIQQLLVLMKSNEYEKITFEWITELEKIIYLINQESIKAKKEAFLNEKSIDNLKTNVNSLKKWQWSSLLIYMDETNRQQIQKNLENIITLVESGNFEKIEIHYFNWFNQIFEVFSKIHSAIEDGYVYDKPTKTWVKNIVQNRNIKRKKRCLFNIFKGFHRLLPRIQIGIGAGRREGKENFIIDLSHKYLVILNELQWIKLVDSDEEYDKRIVIKKINNFIHLVNTRQYRRISRKFLDWLSQLIISLQNTKIRLTGSRKNKRIEIAKKVLVNLPSNWKETILRLRNIDTKLWIKRIQYLLPIIELQEFDKIDFEWLDELQQIIDSITEESKKTVEKPVISEVTIKTVKENVNSLKEWKWETFLKYIDEDKREEVQTTINKMIVIMDSEEFEKLDAQSVDLFNQIFEVFNKMYYAVSNGYVYDEKTKTWVKHVVEVENNQRKKRCILLNLFHGAAKKLIPKINIGIFTGGGNRRTRPVVNQVSIEKVKENIIQLKEMNWENLLQYIDEDKREPIQTNINKIIYVIENEESDKIDSDTIDWLYQIFEQFNKINYAIKNGYVYDQTTKTWVKNTVEVENQIRKKRCFHGKSGKVNKLFRHRPNGFHNKIHLNRLFHFRKNHRKHHRKILPEYRQKFVKQVNWLQKYNWKHLMRFMVDKNKRDTIAKIKYILSLSKNNNYDNIDPDLINWVTNIKTKLKVIKNNRQINENIDENSKIVIKKSHKFIDKLNELKWLEIIDSVEGINKKETIEKINTFINLVKNGKYNEIDTDFINWITEITENIKNTKGKLTETNNNEEVVKKIQINLPSNWKELLQNIEGIDVNLWIARIENLLKLVQNKEYQKIDFDWIDELQNIVKLISQESNKTQEKTVISETTISTIKENVNSLKQWNWETLLKYIDENNRQNIETDVTKMITIIDSGEFEKLDSQFTDWFSQIFELFNKINYAMTNGYVYDEKTKTWVKHVVEEENKSRKRRSVNFEDFSLAKINIDLINQSIEQLQTALSYNLMIIRKNNNQINRENFTKNDQTQLCPFIKKIDEQLITKLTSCSLKQNFICKRQFN